MATYTFNLASFQAACPALASTDPTVLAGLWNTAATFLGNGDTPTMQGPAMVLALNLLTGHLAQSMNLLQSGQNTVAPMIGATEGSVTVSMQPPPVKSEWQYWLASTPYGVQLWALLGLQGAGGFMIGGSLENSSFRRAGGAFIGGGVY